MNVVIYILDAWYHPEIGDLQVSHGLFLSYVVLAFFHSLGATSRHALFSWLSPLSRPSPPSLSQSPQPFALDRLHVHSLLPS